MSAVEQGHGHVFPRPDGTFAKCFGPPHCMACQLDADAKERALATPLASRLALARALVPGWAVVPVEPSRQMMECAVVRHYNKGSLAEVWTAMLTAAEEPPHGP